MTVYAYYRVSTDKQDFENQKFGIMRYCDYKDIIIDKEIIEEGVSGAKDYKQRKLGTLIKKVQKGDMIIVSELSRLSRMMTDMFEIAKKLTDKGVVVYCVKENMEIGCSALGLMIMSVFAFAAQIERERISERTKEALARRKSEGKAIGRQPGCKNKIKKLTPKREVIVKMAADGFSKTKMAAILKCDRETLCNFMRECKIEIKK